jgi:hypothetical protein
MVSKMLQHPQPDHITPRDFIILQQFGPDTSGIDRMCNICREGTASHFIRFLEDLECAIKMEILKIPQKLIEECLWQQTLREQENGNPVIRKTLHTCTSCTDQAIAEATEPRVSLSYFAAVLDLSVSLIVGRYKDDPYRPVAAFTTARTIPEFMDEFNANASKSNDTRHFKTNVPFMKLGKLWT